MEMGARGSIAKRSILAIENPFDKVTVEQFNDDYDLIAYLFAKPEQAIYNKLIGRENYIIVGGWGSGKTMILKYLALETQIADIGEDNVKKSDFIGLYVRVGRGSFKPFLKPGGDFKEGGEALFSHYFNLLVLERVLLVLVYGRDKRVFDFSREQEKALRMRIYSKFSFVNKRSQAESVQRKKFGYNLKQFKSEIANWRREIDTFLNIRDLEENLSYEDQLSIHPTNIRSFLDEVVKDIWDILPDLRNKRFYVLLDECEQFSKGQQRVINTIIKQRLTTLVFKLATRPPDIHTIETIDTGIGLTDRECKHLYLDKEYDPTSASYRKLCMEVAGKRLEKYRYPIKDIKKILGSYTEENEVNKEEIISYLMDNYPSKSRIEDKKKSSIVYKDFKLAALFQILRKKGINKRYAGFNTYVMLSSGIMVHFLELCRDLFNYCLNKYIVRDKYGNLTFKRIPLPIEVQNKASVDVSESFYNDIRGRAESLRESPIDMEFGGKIQNVLSVLGGIFREKLMTFNEPEAARIEIPEGIDELDKSPNNPVYQLFNTAISISAFQRGNPYMPQHIGGIRPPTYILNRILAPYLKISPRPRWRTEIRAELFNTILEAGSNEFKNGVLGKRVKKKEEVEEREKEEIAAERRKILPLFQLMESMPVLSYRSSKIQGLPFKGKTLLILLHFLRDLIPFMEACRKSGVAPQNAILFHKDYRYPNKDSIKRDLELAGHHIYGIEELDKVLKDVETLDRSDIIVIEDGGIIVPKMHASFKGLLQKTLGAVEQTTRGIRNDEKITKCVFPIISIPGSELKDTFEPPHVARAVMNNIQKLLPDKNLSGKSVLLIGYGTIGEQIALQLRDTLNMVVTVCDLDDNKLLKAKQSGYYIVKDLEAGVKDKTIIIGTTGETIIERREILAMEHNTYLISASSEQWEFCISELNALSSEKSEIQREGMKIGTRYQIRGTEKLVNLIADGYPINFWETESMPNEVSDLIMSLIFLSAIEIAEDRSLEPGINHQMVNDIAKRYDLSKTYLECHR